MVRFLVKSYGGHRLMDIREVLKKIDEIETPKVNKVAVAYSGGLDSSLGIELLRRKYKAKKILPITIDVGQGEEEIWINGMADCSQQTSPNMDATDPTTSLQGCLFHRPLQPCRLSR